MKISAWVGRSAPPDSTRLTIGSRLASAISPARWVFFSVYGLTAPPRTVGSFAMIMHGDALDDADAGDHAGADREVGAPAGHRHQLEERRVAVDQQLDALAGQQLAAGVVAGRVLLAAARRGPGQRGVQLGQPIQHRGAVVGERRADAGPER